MSSTFKIKNLLDNCLLKIYRSLIVIFLIVFCLAATAQTPSLKSSLDKYKILIGEPITLNVEATYSPELYNIQWFAIADSADHFEVIERKKKDSVQNNGQLKVSQSIIITSFDSGLRTLPSLQINLKVIADNSAITLLTDSFKVQVVYSPADSVLPFHDIKPIITVKDEWPLWMKIAAILTAILVIYLIYILLKSRKKKLPVKKIAMPKLSAIDEAMQALDHLEKSDVLPSGKVKEFHTTLTGIFKRYTSRKLNEPVDNLTSDELLLILNNKQTSRDAIALTANSFRMADAVKFAKFQPSPEESKDSLVTIRKVISDIEHQQLKLKSDN